MSRTWHATNAFANAGLFPKSYVSSGLQLSWCVLRGAWALPSMPIGLIDSYPVGPLFQRALLSQSVIVVVLSVHVSFRLFHSHATAAWRSEAATAWWAWRESTSRRETWRRTIESGWRTTATRKAAWSTGEACAWKTWSTNTCSWSLQSNTRTSACWLCESWTGLHHRATSWSACSET